MRSTLWKVVLASILLELLLQTFRLPIFAIWWPLLLWTQAPRSLPWGLAWGLVALATTTFFFGPASLDLSLAFLLLLPVFALRPASPWARTAIGVVGLGWCVGALLLGQFPTGSMPFETFFTAAFSRLLPSEWLAGALSRLFLISLTVGAWKLVRRLVERPAGDWVLLSAGLVGAVVVTLVSVRSEPASAAPGATRFEPAAAHGEVFEPFASPKAEPFRHPVLPKALRTRERCATCHHDKLRATDRPRGHKGPHEIHLVLEGLTVECVHCHERAGEPGFPDLSGHGDRRAEYKRRCIECHSRAGSPRLHWKGLYR